MSSKLDLTNKKWKVEVEKNQVEEKEEKEHVEGRRGRRVGFDVRMGWA